MGTIKIMDHPRIITPSNAAGYNSEKMGKATLFQSARMLVGLNGFEVGQEHKLHAHQGMDKMYYVLEGSGSFLLARGQGTTYGSRDHAYCSIRSASRHTQHREHKAPGTGGACSFAVG